MPHLYLIQFNPRPQGGTVSPSVIDPYIRPVDPASPCLKQLMTSSNGLQSLMGCVKADGLPANVVDGVIVREVPITDADVRITIQGWPINVVDHWEGNPPNDYPVYRTENQQVDAIVNFSKYEAFEIMGM